MARLYTRATADGGEEWVAEASNGLAIATAPTMNEAADAAYHTFLRLADLARREGLPTRFVRRMEDEALAFKPAAH